jgi:uncharacterized protein YkwD
MALGWHDAVTRRRLPPLRKVVLIPLAIGSVIVAVIAAFGLGAIVLPTLRGNASPDAGRVAQQPAPGGAVSDGTVGNGGVGDGTSGSPDPTPVDDPTESPEASPSGSTAAPPSAGDNQFEAVLVALLNAERQKARCGPVRVEGRLRTSALTHSLDMAGRNFLNLNGSDRSTPIDRMNRAGYGQGKSEVVAKGSADPQAVVRAWVRGQQQRRTVLDCAVRAVGVGLAFRGRTAYWTADFGTI